MFFLGHMTWAYVFAAMLNRKSGVKLFVPAVLMLGVLPDIDLFLCGFGVTHQTFTHSLFFWLVFLVPFLLVYRRMIIPYFVALVQHFAFGDLLLGEVMLFWPLSSSKFGFNNGMLSLFVVGLEITGLLLAVGFMYFNGDLKRLLSVNIRNVLMFLPFLALVSSMLFFAVDWPIIPLIAYIWSSPFLTTIVIAHLILTVFLAISTLQGLRKF